MDVRRLANALSPRRRTLERGWLVFLCSNLSLDVVFGGKTT